MNHIDLIERYDAAFTDAVSEPGALALSVPSCPEWTVADLVGHLGEVQSAWTMILRDRGTPPAWSAHDATPGADVLGWWQEKSAALLAELRAAPADSSAWCWWNEEKQDTAAGVAWRQAHEVLVHCWDARNAVGTLEPMDPEVAADGVDEFLVHCLRGGEWVGRSGVLVLEASDLDRAWTVSTESGKPQLVLDRRLRPAASTVTATAERLDLLLWGRVPLAGPDVTGDATLAEGVLGWPRL